MKDPAMNTTFRRDIRVLAISTYELGHQPLILARLATALDSLGISTELCDNSIFNRPFADKSDFQIAGGEFPTHLVISVPMHTATQLGKTIASRAREFFGNSITIIAVGLYAKVALSFTGLFDIGVPQGSNEQIMEAIGVKLDDSIRSNLKLQVPDRSKLPEIHNYAHLLEQNGKRLVGYVETTTGCAHSCKHCPVPVVHHGSFRAIAASIVLKEIDQLYKSGARHITFGDPDFLNGPTHSLKITRAMHQKYPDLTFDATIKIEHILENRNIWAEMAELGLTLVVSAFEHTSDLILTKLAKGHTKAQIVEALQLLRSHGIEVRPSLLPFTPWTDRQSLIELIEFIYDNNLVESVDPVQLSIRLLIPLDSLVLGDEDLQIGPWNPDLLSFEWRSSDPLIDELQLQLSQIAQDSLDRQMPSIQVFDEMRRCIYGAFSLTPPTRSQYRATCEEKPRLSEAWFCCAEPTRRQLNLLDREQSIPQQ